MPQQETTPGPATELAQGMEQWRAGKYQNTCIIKEQSFNFLY